MVCTHGNTEMMGIVGTEETVTICHDCVVKYKNKGEIVSPYNGGG